MHFNQLVRNLTKFTSSFSLRSYSSSSQPSHDTHSHSDSHHGKEPEKKQSAFVKALLKDRPLLDYNEYMKNAQGFQRFDFWRNHPLLNVNPIQYPKEWQYFLPGWKVGLAVIFLILILELLGLKQRVFKDPVEEYHNEVTLKRIPEEFREEAKHLMHH